MVQEDQDEKAGEVWLLDGASAKSIQSIDTPDIDDVVCPGLTPGQALFRYSILLGCCFLTFGSYFCYDIPAALNCELEDVRTECCCPRSDPIASFAWYLCPHRFPP